MTNHEHRPAHQHHPDAVEQPGPLGRLEQTLRESRLAATRYAESGGAHGSAFIAYMDLDLGLDWDIDEEADFLDRCVGYYPDRASFITDHLDTLGCAAALTRFRHARGLQAGDLVWDTGVLWEHFGDTHHLVEHFGGVYAFRR